ncbi:hypothetical protein E2C01_040642 [Portunus trituberculatus]|uniref:Uncharacterized protein n=1 Tax=Portunus trituberculatus TaxID=210409 RepID=A0A5B7FHY7_PORTR|nr:hypothetical protein [Portunus trituberculatus]
MIEISEGERRNFVAAVLEGGSPRIILEDSYSFLNIAILRHEIEAREEDEGEDSDESSGGVGVVVGAGAGV